MTTLPAGLFGNPTAIPRCSLTVLTGSSGSCSPDTQLGMIRLKLHGARGGEQLGPLYNVTPEAGQSAEFATRTAGADFFLTAHLVHTAQGYSIVVEDNGIPSIGIVEAELTFWGVPAESRYDWMRGLECSNPESGVLPLCNGFQEWW